MLTAGDEFGRTQAGNNNAYCQDNEISWIDWALLEANRELFEFTRQLIALRKKHPALCSGKFYTGKGDVEWIGEEGLAIDWQHDRALGMHIKGKDQLLILINNESVDLSFDLPGGNWKLLLSTDPLAKSSASGDAAFLVPAHSVCVLGE